MLSNGIENNLLSRRDLLLTSGAFITTGFLSNSNLNRSELIANDGDSNVPDSIPLYAFCGTGDHLWGHYLDPVDSQATIAAMMEWMSETHHISRMYWRGGQSMMWDQSYRVGSYNLKSKDWHDWKHHLYNDLKINEVAVSEAKRTEWKSFFIRDCLNLVCSLILE